MLCSVPCITLQLLQAMLTSYACIASFLWESFGVFTKINDGGCGREGFGKRESLFTFLDHRRKTNLLRACQNLLTLIRTVVMNSLLSIGPQYHSRIGSQDN